MKKEAILYSQLYSRYILVRVCNADAIVVIHPTIRVTNLNSRPRL